MKKIGLLMLAVFFLPLLTTAGASVEVSLLNPTDGTFVRGTGEPITVPKTFPGKSGQAKIIVYNGGTQDDLGEKVSSSIISVNGNIIFSPSEFNQNVLKIEKSINLIEGNNLLEVQLKGKPGGKIRVEILQLIEADAGKTIGANGGVIEVIDPNNPSFGLKIEIPADAVSEPTIITAKAINSYNNFPDNVKEAGRIFEFKPDGITFQKDILITFPYSDNDNNGIIDNTDNEEIYVAGLTYDNELLSWLFMKKIRQDNYANTITVATNHFTDKGPGVIDKSQYGPYNVLFFVIDGLEKGKIGPDFTNTYRPEYIMPAIQYMLGLKNADIYSYGQRMGDGWDGDADQTEKIIPKLVKKLEDQRNLADSLGKKFCLIGHSWGTVLSFLALAYSDVEPDLFLTLSSPLGTLKNTTAITQAPFLYLPIELYLNVQFNDVWWELLKKFKTPQDPKFKKWINFWAPGDPISGPIETSLTLFYKVANVPIPFIFNFSEIKNISVDNIDLCNLNSLNIYHAITSLDARGLEYFYFIDDGAWETYLTHDWDLKLAKKFRNIVRNEILLELDLDNDSDGDYVPDTFDKCLNTPNSEMINDEGCSVSQLAVGLIDPGNGGTNLDYNNINFQWSRLDHPSESSFQYCLTINEDREPSDYPIWKGCEVGSFTYDTSVRFTLDPGKRYYWAVWAKDPNGVWSKSLPASEWFTFTTYADNDRDGIADQQDPDDDNDGMPDEWEIANGLNPLLDDADLDADNDGFVNIEEYEAGTDPRDANSNPGIIDLNRGLVAYYPFDGNANDASGNGLNGVAYGGISYVAGAKGQAANFDGVNDYVVVNDKPELRLSDTDFTLSAWVKEISRDSSYADTILFKRNLSQKSGWGLTITGLINNEGAGKVGFSNSGGYEPAAFSINTVSLGTFHHIVAVYKKTEKSVSLYIDGELDSTAGNIPSPNPDEVSNLFIGKDSSGNQYLFQGLIDEVRIYNRALFENEIQELFQIGNTQNQGLFVPSQYENIQAAIDASQPGETIYVADGTYSGSGNIDLDFKGKAIILKSENGPNSTTINCEGIGRAFYFHSGEKSSAKVDGFTISNGRADNGGAIYISGSSPTIFNCRFINNYAQQYGGSIYLDNRSGLVIRDSIFSNNRSEYLGGGIAIRNSWITITGSEFTGNSSSTSGGAIYNAGNGSIYAANCTFNGNSAKYGGGGLYISGLSTITNSIFNGNSAGYSSVYGSSSGGGAIYYNVQAGTGNTPTLEKSKFFYNDGKIGTGGAIYITGDNANIKNCIFSQNSAKYGGGIGSGNSNWGINPRIYNCTLYNNSATTSGGAIAAFQYSYVNITNSIVWNNTAPSKPNFNFLPTITYSNIEGGYEGIGNFDLDPIFVDSYNKNFKLQANSPCIDAGIELSNVVDDIEGNPRPFGSSYDIGAYEFQY